MCLRERPRTTAKVCGRPPRDSPFADCSGHSRTQAVRENPLMSRRLIPWTFSGPRKSTNVHDHPRKIEISPWQTIADFRGQ